MEVKKFVPKKLTRKVGEKILKAQKHSPHLLFGAGIVGVVGGTVLACRATLKLGDTLDDFKGEVETNAEHATPRDLTYIYVKNTAKVAKLYAPAVVVGVAGIACLTGSHVQLTRRNTALTAAYAAVSNTFANYRDRVTDEFGAEKEKEIYQDTVRQDALDNKQVKPVGDTNKLSGYARIFDEGNKNWESNAEFNMMFLKCQQNFANQLLQVRGHVFLNEVYDALGFEHSSAGSVVGWYLNGDGDNYIDFGLYDPHSSRFVNGDEKSIILDFNVDGVIFDKIG